jgi:Asp-tRNA(Asn)/Glu-tRNA(Gln) amidotransferase A subunit family amidase
MPTGYGSAIYEGHRPAADAACVALARAAGAIVLGKTVTTEFACFTAGKTANPRNPSHTPGGSSSGSAAAVADGMVPLGFGTQTAGSVIRPASFCGCVGYKPSFGVIPRAGVKALADSLDTVGVMARSVDDAAFFTGVLAGRPALRDIAMPAAAPRFGL